MPKTTELEVCELIGRKRTASRLAQSARNHQTLCTAILYVVAICVVLAFVARL